MEDPIGMDRRPAQQSARKELGVTGPQLSHSKMHNITMGPKRSKRTVKKRTVKTMVDGGMGVSQVSMGLASAGEVGVATGTSAHTR